MILEVRLFATLRQHFPDYPNGVMSVDVPEGATAGDLIDQLKIDPDEIKLIMLNGVQAELEQPLKENDRIGLFPPVGGG